MNGTRNVPSRALLQYLGRYASSKRCCSIHQSPLPYGHINCRAVPLPSLRLGQQHRHLVLAQILKRKKPLPTDHKLSEHTEMLIRDEDDKWWKEQKISLWAQETKKSQPEYLGIQTLAQVMKNFLGPRRTTQLGPPGKDGHGWLLVRKNDEKRPTGYDRQNEDDLEDYILVRPKPETMPKEIKNDKARGAKLLYMKSGNFLDYMRVVLSKAYGFVQLNSNVEFHIKYGRSLLGEDEMTRSPGGLAFRPELIAKSLGAVLCVQPLTNGFEVVFVIRSQSGDKKAINLQKKGWEDNLKSTFEHLRKLEATGKSVLKRERRHDKAIRMLREDADIKRLKEQGESYKHILEQRKKIEERNSQIIDHFAKKNLARKEKVRLKVEKRKALARERHEERLREREIEVQQMLEENSWEQLEKLDTLGDSYFPAETEHQDREADSPSWMNSGIQLAKSTESSPPSNWHSVQDGTAVSKDLSYYPAGGAPLVRTVSTKGPEWSTRRIRTITTGDWDSPDERPISVRRVMDTVHPPVHNAESAESAEGSSSTVEILLCVMW
ncbi:hypothetical protein ACMFMF_004990 [Clarireedia jacksonii]